MFKKQMATNGFKAMPNSIDFYKEIFLHIIPVRIIVPWSIKNMNEMLLWAHGFLPPPPPSIPPPETTVSVCYSFFPFKEFGHKFRKTMLKITCRRLLLRTIFFEDIPEWLLLKDRWKGTFILIYTYFIFFTVTSC